LRPGFSHTQTRFINNHSFGEKLAKSTVYENKGLLISPSFCGPRHDSPNITGWAITLIKACPDKLRTMLKDSALKTFGISVPSYPDPAKQTKDGNMINKQDKYISRPAKLPSLWYCPTSACFISIKTLACLYEYRNKRIGLTGKRVS
jgi:hypothetical protein